MKETVSPNQSTQQFSEFLLFPRLSLKSVKPVTLPVFLCLRHLLAHWQRNLKPLTCDCGKLCQSRKGLTQHNATPSASTSSTTIILTCTQCGTHCKNNSALLKHAGSQRCKQRQAVQQKSMSLTLVLSDTENDTSTPQPKCVNCGKCYKNMSGLASHRRFCKVKLNHFCPSI